MKLPSILEVLDDSRMVNDARDMEMQGRAFSFAKRSEIRRDFCKIA